MKRLFLRVLLYSLLSLSSLSAADFYYFPYASCFSIDLEHERKGTANGNYNGEYNDSDMVGLLGAANILGDDSISFKISFDEDSTPWVYKSISDPTLEIPFGLDLVVRYDKLIEENLTAGVVHVGYNSKQNDESDNHIKLSKDEDGIVNGFTVEISDSIIFDEGYWKNVWLDLVIVIPLNMREKFKYGSADDYQAKFKITVASEDKETSYDVMMTGYYGNYDVPSSGYLMFTVSPNAAATSLDLSSNPYDEQIIGTFIYSTSAFRPVNTDDISDGDDYIYAANLNDKKSKIKMYVSSSRVPNDDEAELFTLRNINTPDSSATSLNIGFEIGLRSDNSKITEWYNGTKPSDDGEKNRYLKGYGIYEKSRDKAGLTLFDEGKILFKVNEDENLQEKLSGYYSANIYFHLIAEE